MTAPAASRQRVTVRSRLYSSGYWRGERRLAARAAARGMSGPPSPSGGQLLEDPATMFEVLELVVGLTRRREQHDVAGTSGVARLRDGHRELAAVDPGAQDGADRRPVGADQVDAGAALRHRLAQRREVLALAPSAEDQVDRAVEGLQRPQRGVDVGRLGVVDVQDAVVLGDLLE